MVSKYLLSEGHIYPIGISRDGKKYYAYSGTEVLTLVPKDYLLLPISEPLEAEQRFRADLSLGDKYVLFHQEKAPEVSQVKELCEVEGLKSIAWHPVGLKKGQSLEILSDSQMSLSVELSPEQGENSSDGYVLLLESKEPNYGIILEGAK